MLPRPWSEIGKSCPLTNTLRTNHNSVFATVTAEEKINYFITYRCMHVAFSARKCIVCAGNKCRQPRVQANQVLLFVKSSTTYSSVHFFWIFKTDGNRVKCLVASRGYHVYGKTVWAAPKRGQKLYAKKETNQMLRHCLSINRR